MRYVHNHCGQNDLNKFPVSTKIEVKDKINQSTIKVALSKKDTLRTTPHKHNSYFEIIYLSKGAGIHVIDSVKYPVKTPVVYNIRREQLHYWELESQPEGYVLILKKEFVDHSLDKQLKELLNNVCLLPYIHLQKGHKIGQLFQMLLDEYKPDQNNNTPVIEGLLKVLLAKIISIGRSLTSDNGQNRNLFQEFYQLLTQDKLLKNNVTFYASHLKTSPQNLSSACRKSQDNQPGKC